MKTKVKGLFTVEATFLVPVTLIIICYLILGFSVAVNNILKESYTQKRIVSSSGIRYETFTIDSMSVLEPVKCELNSVSNVYRMDGRFACKREFMEVSEDED